MAETPEFEARAAMARALPPNFGEGWLSRPARDMVRMAAFAGFDVSALVRRLAGLKLRVVQERHVLSAMDEMSKGQLS